MQSASVGTTSQRVDTGSYTSRYFSLVNDVGGYVCRQIFLQECSKKKGSLTTFLDDNKEAIKESSVGNSSTKVFSLDQINKLFPDGGTASSAEEFDISLSLSLLRTFIFPSTATRGTNIWKQKKLDEINVNWTSTVVDLARVRLYRNKIHDIKETSTFLSEEDFWSYWSDLTRIFLHLGKKYNIPDVCRKIDNLLNKTLDEAREKELDNKIKLLSEEVARSTKIEEKILECVQTVDSSHEGTSIIEEIDIKDDVPESIFKRTKQYEKARKALIANKIIVIDGAPGEGKTTVAKKLVVEVSEIKPRQLMTTGDWENFKYDKSDVDAIFIDDMFGAGVFDKEESRKWLKILPKIEKWVNKDKRYFVMTSRTYILEEARNNMLYLENTFTDKNVFTLSSSKLKSNEKLEILKNHFSNKELKHIQGKKAHDSLLREISQLKFEPLGPSFSIGFPECTRLFANSKQLYETGVDFFQKPMKHIMKCISEIIKKDNAFVAFFVLWAQSNRTLEQTDLECSLRYTPERIKDPIRYLQYPTEPYVRHILGELQNHVHKGGFVELDRMKETYRFSHEVVRDAVGLVTYKKNATAAIACCDAGFIENYVRIPSSLTENVAETKLGDEELNNVFLSLPSSRFDQICQRITTLIIPDVEGSDVNRENYTLFKHQLFSNEKFCTTFIKKMKERESLEQLLTTKVRSIDSSLITYDYLDLNKIETEVRLPSFLLWQSEQLSELAKQCLVEMSQNKDENFKKEHFQKELSISLLIAASIDSLETVKFLLGIDGKITYKMLLIAYTNQNKCMLDYLKEHSGFTDSDASDLKQASLYHIAIDKENIDLIDLLLKEGVPFNCVDEEKRTPFLHAICIGKTKLVKKLEPIAFGQSADMIPDKSNNTPLHVAIKKSVKGKDRIRKKVFKELSVTLCQNCKVNLNLKNSQGHTSLYLAYFHNAIDIIEALREKEAHLAEENSTLLHEFVKADKINVIKTLLNIGFDHTVQDAEGRTPLKLAEELDNSTAADVLRKLEKTE